MIGENDTALLGKCTGTAHTPHPHDMRHNQRRGPPPTPSLVPHTPPTANDSPSPQGHPPTPQPTSRDSAPPPPAKDPHAPQPPNDQQPAAKQTRHNSGKRHPADAGGRGHEPPAPPTTAGRVKTSPRSPPPPPPGGDEARGSEGYVRPKLEKQDFLRATAFNRWAQRCASLPFITC